MPSTVLIRPYPRTNDPKDLEKWFNELRHKILQQAATTDGLTEGTTNLYFTNERVDDRVAALIQSGNVITWVYNDSAGTLTPTVGIDTTKGLDVSSGKIILVLASNKGLAFDGSGDLYIKDGDAIKVSSAGVEVDYNSTNLKITANQLNTIQDIATTSSPTFKGMTKVGTGSNYTQFENDTGFGVAFGSAQAWDDCVAYPLAVNIGAAIKAPSYKIFRKNSGGTSNGVPLPAFARGGNEDLPFQFQIPHRYALATQIEFHIHLASVANATNVKHKWQLEYTAAAIGGVFPVTDDTTMVKEFSGDIVAYTHTILDFSYFPETTLGISGIIVARLSRIASAATEFTGDLYLLGADCHFKCDTLGSRQETSKT